MRYNILKLLVLYLIAIIFTVINLNNITYLNSSAFLPLFEIMIIYYFAIYKNNIFGFWFLFLIGIWGDALVGLPIGITSFIYLIVVKLFNFIRYKQVLQENLASIMAEFTIFIFVILTLKWLFLSIYYKNIYDVTPFILQMIISCIAYILIHKFFDFLSKKILKDH